MNDISRPDRTRLSWLALLVAISMVIIIQSTPTTRAANLCGIWDTDWTSSSAYYAQNNVWGASTTQCINITSSTNWTVTASHTNSTSGAPASYPSVIKGCHSRDLNPAQNQLCTAGWTNYQTGSITAASTNWTFTAPSTGAWDAAYDIWYGPNAGTYNGTEIMIWLNWVGPVQPIGSVIGSNVTVDGTTWEVWAGQTSGGSPSVSWKVISYRRVTKVNSATINILAFQADAITRNQLTAGHYLTGIDAGFEIWQGGTGFGTSAFAASVTGTGGVGVPTNAPTSTPITFAVPGTIQAESYASMSGVQTETTTDTGGGLNVGYIEANDWMDYAVNVASAGSYTLQYRVASTGSTGQIQLRNSSGTTLATTSVPSTGGWQTWTTVNTTVNLTAGAQTLRLFAGGSGFNVNWFQLSSAAGPTATTAPPPPPTATATMTSTPVGPAPTSTPVPPPPPTSTPGSGNSTLKAQYKAAETMGTATQIKPHLQIVNTGTGSVALSDLKARYYYSKEGTAAESYYCDYAVKGCGNVTGSFASGYFEMGFTAGAGSLAAGQSSGEVQNRFAKSDWTNYTQTGDYSFDPTKTAFADWDKVTIYQNGTLVWGTPG
jgi:hypothetical protein